MRHSKALPFLSKLFEPTQVFTALLIAVIIWLYPVVFPLKADAQPLYGGPCGRTCNLGCCISGACSKCPEGDPDVPPTISGLVSCSQPGNNGWCIGSLTLNLAAADPQGQAVIISGDVNGLTFTCPYGNIACFVPITNEGIGTVNFIVNSATGLSASGSATYKLDLSTPQIDGNLSGANGANDWFISDVTFSASAIDSVSDLAALEISTDGGGWTAYNAPITLSDGVHTVALRAYDYAGNLAETNQTISIDTLTPVLDSSVNGVAGMNGWYVSDTQVSATANDSGSGLFMLEVSTDGGAWTGHSSPITLSDGVHTIQFRATDNAGNVTESTQTIKVDTITPTLNISVDGRTGMNGWYTSITQVSAASSDSGSGVAAIEGAADSGAWGTFNSLSFSDGLHTYEFKATDNAGNSTTIPVQNIKVDTIAPAINMTETLLLGETVYYSLEDNGSGLSIYRAVVEDDAEKYKKIVWLDDISGNKLEDQILWDGKFADGAKAAWGEYFITLKISDAAGNETMKTAVVSVNLLSALQIIPPFTPPQTSPTTTPAPATRTGSEPSTGFGGTNNGAKGEITSSSLASAGGIRAEGGAMSVHTWTKAPTSAAPAIPQSSILWGAAATALVGATLADWKRKRDEEERRAREERQANGPSPYRKIAMAYQASLNNFKATVAKAVALGMSAKEAQALKSQVINSGKIGASLNMATNHITREVEAANARDLQKERDALLAKADEAARLKALEEQHKAEELQAGLAAYYQGRKVGEAAVTPPKEKKTWWENTIDWIDKYQVEISIGIGVAVGVAAIIATGGTAAPLVMAAWIAGSAVVAGGTVALGTVGMNAYYGRPLGENVVRNLVIAGGTAAVMTGAGFLFQGAIQGAASYCALNSNSCAKVEPVLNAFDTAEEGWLIAKGSYQTWIGDGAGAADTAIELQMEQMDGGMPGNSISHEVSEQLAKLGDDVPELIATYGDEIVPLLLQYGDEAVNIIGAHGDEGITLLLKFGDDTGDAINLVKQYGTPAVKVLDAVDLPSAKKLLTAMDKSAIDLDYAIAQGPDAVRALSYWPDDFLVKYGDELVLRAKDDARTLEAASKLAKLKDLNSKEAQDLIDTIANNSIRGDGNRLVLGKWVNDGTLDNGFIGVARADGALFYSTNPGLEKILYESTDVVKEQEALFWAVNNRVLEISVAHDFKIDYSLDGIDPDDIPNEVKAISAIASGKNRDEVAEYFGGKFPFRMREVEVLISHGYKFEVDGAASMIHWIKP
jgi:hypothetical protein